MNPSNRKAITVVCAFSILVLLISVAFHPHYSLLVMVGENSVGTWMSGVLLVMAATLSLLIGMRQGWSPWFLIVIFFMILALDERFMFHEQVKERIRFSFPEEKDLRWFYELPVLTGACAGALVTYILWKHIRAASRTLLLCAMVLGTASVVFDVFAAGVFWEECFKLVGELSMVCALLSNVE